MPETGLRSVGTVTVVALLSCLAQVSIARAAPAFCISKVSSYVVELDQLLSRERNWITPYFDLNDRYSPFVDCDVDALLEEVSRSRFARPITYGPRSKTYFIEFSSNDVSVSFAYQVDTRKTLAHSATFTRK
jgi:hypothetical protein